MPRHFTDADRETIRKQLLGAGLKRFVQFGLRGMRVDDVCRDTGIAKGSFYAFFDSKEDLFLAIADQRDAMHKADMLAFFDAAHDPAASRIARFFDLLVEKIQGDPLLSIVSVPEEMAALMRKIPAERIAHEQKKDADFLEAFCARLVEDGAIAPVRPQILSSLMVLLVCLVLQRPLIPPEAFTDAQALLRETFVSRLTGDLGP